MPKQSLTDVLSDIDVARSRAAAFLDVAHDKWEERDEDAVALFIDAASDELARMARLIKKGAA